MELGSAHNQRVVTETKRKKVVQLEIGDDETNTQGECLTRTPQEESACQRRQGASARRCCSRCLTIADSSSCHGGPSHSYMHLRDNAGRFQAKRKSKRKLQ